MLQRLTATLYDWLTRSHILFYMIPIIRPFYVIIGSSRMRKDYVTDDVGNTMKVTMVNGRILPAFGETRLSTIKDVKIKEDDVMLCSYPKTGTQFTYEILFMLKTGIAKQSPYGKLEGGMIDAIPNIILESIPSPRVLNSHLLFDELPSQLKEKRTKIVLTIRCPKDTVVSYFNHVKSLNQIYQYSGQFDDYFRMFMKGNVDCEDYFDYYMDWDRVMRSKDKTNEIFLLSFEELKENPVAKIKELAKFLDITITGEFADQIAEASNFRNSKKKRPKNVLLRKGEVGDWKNWLTDEQKAEVDLAWREKMADFRMGTMRDGYTKTGD